MELRGQGLLVGFVLWLASWPVGLAVMGASAYACSRGRRWRRMDLDVGGDHAAIAQARLGVGDLMERRSARQRIEQDGWVGAGKLVVGRDERDMPVSIPVGYDSGSHALVVGATGSGKTVSEAWIVTRLIDAGYGAIALDPKGDLMLRDELARAAPRAEVPFLEWTPEGPLAYNPYAHGRTLRSPTRRSRASCSPSRTTCARPSAISDMPCASCTPPHRGPSLMAHLDPRELEVSARKLPEEEAKVVEGYLDSLADRQRRDLAGVRDRLSILAESDTGRG